MSTISLNGGRCAKCGKQPVAIGIPVFRDLSVGSGGGGGQGGGRSGVDTSIWCIDCVRRLLHQEGEDEVVAGG